MFDKTEGETALFCYGWGPGPIIKRLPFLRVVKEAELLYAHKLSSLNLSPNQIKRNLLLRIKPSVCQRSGLTPPITPL